MAIVELTTVLAITVFVTVLVILVGQHQRDRNRKRHEQGGRGPVPGCGSQQLPLSDPELPLPLPLPPPPSPAPSVISMSDFEPGQFYHPNVEVGSISSVESAGELMYRVRGRRPGSVGSTSSTRSLSCGICLESYSSERIKRTGIASVACGHVYCREHLTEWVGSYGNCPACRTPASLEDLRPIFL